MAIEQQSSPSSTGRYAAGALAGFLAALVALGAAELVAAVLARTSSPVIAVGGAFVDRTPRALKEFAIRTFAENDKNVLIGGVVLTVLLLAALVGILSLRRPAVGYVAVAVLGVVAAGAAVSRPNATWLDAVPSLLGGAAGFVALLLLLRPLLRPPVGDAVRSDRTSEQERRRAGVRPGIVDRLRDSVSMGDRKGEVDRRAFLLTSLGAGAAAIAAGAGGRAALGRRLDVSASRDAIALPAPASRAPALPAGAKLDVAGVSPFYTASREFYRVDTALVVPQLATSDWRLKVHGMVERELELTWDDLVTRPLVERDITLTCVSNEVGGRLVGTARWLGAPLKELLAEARPHQGADQLVSSSVDGMTIGTPTAVATDGRDAMLAIAMNGEPLLPAHGFPVRMLVPGLYGYVSATKWVVDLELTTFNAFDPYWVKRGWAEQGPIKTAARIDTPRPLSSRGPGKVAVAGVAWAQHRGIERVEVRVDGGDWAPARLSAPVSKDLWRQWVWEWDAQEPGTHKLEARATDASGQIQPERRVPVFPDGSTGWHSVVVRIDE